MRSIKIRIAVLVLSSFISRGWAQTATVMIHDSDSTANKKMAEVPKIVSGPEIEHVQLGKSTITGEQIELLPSQVGVPDLMRTLRSVPGVSMAKDGNSSIIVRGGNLGQNLVLWDGMKIYNTNHYYGLASLFNADMIKTADIYKGDFPLQYGGGASSVLDIKTKDGNFDKVGLKASIGTMSSSLFFEAPLGKNVSIALAGRTAYTGLKGRRDQKEYEDNGRRQGSYTNYTLYDWTGKLTWRINDNHKLALSVFNGVDKYSSGYSDNSRYSGFSSNNNGISEGYNIYNSHEKEGITHIENSGISLSHQYTKGQFSLKNTLSASSYANKITHYYNSLNSEHRVDSVGKSHNTELYEKEDNRFRTGIKDLTWNSTAEIVGERNRVVAGIEVSGENVRPYETYTYAIDGDYVTGYNNLSANKKAGYWSESQALAISVFGSDEFKIDDQWSVMAGLRATNYMVKGTDYFMVEPRLSSRYMLSPNSSIKASYSRMNQYNHSILEVSEKNETQMWLLSDEDIKPETSNNFSLGYFWDNRRNLTFSAEAFYKKMNDLVEYANCNKTLITGDDIASSIYSGVEGRSYGIELNAGFHIDRLSLNATYVFSRSERRSDELNLGRWFDSHYDRTHDLNIAAIWRLNKNWSFSGNYVFMTGSPVTVSNVADNGVLGWYNVVDRINNYRTPSYHRLDLGVNYEIETRRHHRLKLSLGLYNIYCHENNTVVDLDGNASYGNGTPWTNRIYPTFSPTLTLTYTL